MLGLIFSNVNFSRNFTTCGFCFLRHAKTSFHVIAFREGEDWHRMRKALASKMLRPKDVRDNMDNFTAVTRDAIEHMVSIRGADMEIPDLSKELAQWATECKFLEAGIIIQLPGQLN